MNYLTIRLYRKDDYWTIGLALEGTPLIAIRQFEAFAYGLSLVPGYSAHLEALATGAKPRGKEFHRLGSRELATEVRNFMEKAV